MKKQKIYITRRIPDVGIKMLQKKFDVKINEQDKVLSRVELLKNVKGVDAILSLLTDKIDGEVMDAAGENLKVVGNYAVGVNNIDLEAAKERGVMVTNTPGVLTDSVAEYTFALIMAIAHRIVEADKFSRAGKYKGWAPMLMLGDDLMGKTLGIIGLGRIGFGVVERAVGMGMKVVYNDPERNKSFEKKYKAKYLSKENLLKQSDVVSLHVPLLPSTTHLIGAKELKLMKKTAFLINTSRGPVVDERALVIALERGDIKGAAIDVFECEPKLGCNVDIAKRFKKLDNAILTPHIASAALDTRTKMSEMVASNIDAALSGKKPLNPVK